MHHRSDLDIHRTTRRRLGTAALAAAGLSVAALAGCGSSASDGSSGASTSTATEGAAFCTAVDDFVDASTSGDRTAMADALSSSLDGLPAEAQRDVAAYIEALRTPPPNQEPDGDGVENEQTEEAFRSYVTETCGKDALPEPPASTTTSEASDGGSSSGGSGSSGTDTGDGTGSSGSDMGGAGGGADTGQLMGS